MAGMSNQNNNKTASAAPMQMFGVSSGNGSGSAAAASAPQVPGPIVAAAIAAAAAQKEESTDILFPDLKLSSDISEVEFHPRSAAIAIALVTGEVQLFNYSAAGHRPLYSVVAHKKGASARSVQFSFDGRSLYSGGADKAITTIDVESGKVVSSIEKAHEYVWGVAIGRWAVLIAAAGGGGGGV